MNKTEFLKGMKILSSSYFKDITNDDLSIWYNLLNKMDGEIFLKTVYEIIEKNKYFPSIAEIKKEYKIQNQGKKYEILEKMKADGYFKKSEYGISEYEKACKWLETGIIPKWFKEDMKKYNKKQKIIENKQEKLLKSKGE